jgi:hypothetical protein
VSAPLVATDLGRWTATLFIIGSSLFALGSFPVLAARVDARAAGATFVLGSVFFTSAAYCQYLQTINGAARGTVDRRRFWSFTTRNAEWWTASVQLVGTLLFNVSTTGALISALYTHRDSNLLVWGPDIFGSTAFLIASQLGWWSVCGTWWCVRRSSPNWWMAVLNYAGSIFFMASAIAALTLPTTGQELDVALVNSATFFGALFFLAAAVVQRRVA